MIETNTLLDVANSALLAIGDRTISALNDKDDKTSMQVSSIFRQVIMDIQGAANAPWRELYTTTRLILHDAAPCYGEWVFNKPTNCMVLVSVGNGRGRQDELVARCEGRFIYIDCSTLSSTNNVLCRYSKLSLDPAEWGADLRGCVISLLSARLAGVLTATPTASQALEKAFWEGEFVRRTGNAIVSTEGQNAYWRGHYVGV